MGFVGPASMTSILTVGKQCLYGQILFNIYLFAHTYIHAHTCVPKQTLTHKHTHTHTHMHAHTLARATHTHVHKHTHTHTCMHTHLHVPHTHMSTITHTHARTHACTHARTHTTCTTCTTRTHTRVHTCTNMWTALITFYIVVDHCGCCLACYGVFLLFLRWRDNVTTIFAIRSNLPILCLTNLACLIVVEQIGPVA